MKIRDISEDERIDWMQLAQTGGVGPVTFLRLIRKFETARGALNAVPAIASRGRGRALRLADRGAAEAELDRARQAGIDVIALCEPTYPADLRRIPDPPPLLYVRGHAVLFERPAIAVVGARNASAAGRAMATRLASDLNDAGYVIVSGLAHGIDGVAHEAALKGGTLAVVAGGVDIAYPPEHAALTEAIAAEGAVLSERALGLKPTGRDFPRRNRLISGLSKGVIIVEAAERSGTLITARCALEQNRDVFAVPGSPLDPRCTGSNSLINDYAKLVQTAEDVLETLEAASQGLHEIGADEPEDLSNWGRAQSSQPIDDHTDQTELRERVREALSYTPTHGDEIIRALALPTGRVLDALMELVLASEAEEHAGGCFTLTVNRDEAPD